MKLDELSFAAQVLDIANKMCETDWKNLQADSDRSSPESAAKLEAWVSENNALSYVPQALSLITKAAEKIALIQSGDR